MVVGSVACDGRVSVAVAAGAIVAVGVKDCGIVPVGAGAVVAIERWVTVNVTVGKEVVEEAIGIGKAACPNAERVALTDVMTCVRMNTHAISAATPARDDRDRLR
jgi:hypothetical protein